MRSSGSSNHEQRRYRPLGSVEDEENGKPTHFLDTLDCIVRSSARDDGKIKKFDEIYVAKLGKGKGQQVKLKSLTLKFVLLSLLFLTAFLTVTFPIASFESERDLLIAAQQHWNASFGRAKKVALMWEIRHAKETTGKKPTKPQRSSGSFISSEKKLRPPLPYWKELSSLLASHVADYPSGQLRIGLLNFDEKEASEQPWDSLTLGGADPDLFEFKQADRNLTWKDLFPEWIDEEEVYSAPECPSLPMPTVEEGKRLDVVVAKIRCRKSGDWARDVERLHLHLATARVAESTESSHVLLLSECVPIPNIFTCRELVVRRGDLWLYKVDLAKMRKKLAMPVGSCELAVPLNPRTPRTPQQTHNSPNAARQAYATILHSAELYVCGAIALAHSIRSTGSTRDLLILVDSNISPHNLAGLEQAGWKIHQIERIRNPRADADTYNEWNYSKLRLWQLWREYSKLIFIDADVIVLRNLDFLFEEGEEITASGNSRTVFNSGVMVVEPAPCTFELLMSQVNSIVSYNGGDQGFLNEIFTWWHRLPRHMNFLKHLWSSSPEELHEKTRLFGSRPPQLFALHFLGFKPWLCFKDYDCSWNVPELRHFASDVAHATWWSLHDSMPLELQEFCTLSTNQTALLTYDLELARSSLDPDPHLHWQRNISDPRFLYPLSLL